MRMNFDAYYLAGTLFQLFSPMLELLPNKASGLGVEHLQGVSNSAACDSLHNIQEAQFV